MPRLSLRQRNQIERHREYRLYNLIRKAQLTPSLENYQDVVNYLSNTQDFEPMEKILEHLDGSLIPSIPLEVTNRDIMKRIELAAQSIYSCVPLFRSFRYAPRKTPQVKAYLERCIEMLLENWGAVKGWMAFLVMHAPQANNPKKILQDCTDALIAILADAEESPAKQEMVSMPGTADLIYILLCQTDRSTGKYQILRVYDHPRAHCALTELFRHSFDSTAGWDAMEQRLRAVSRTTRRKIITALGGRAEQMAQEAIARNMLGYALSFPLLLEGVFRLSSHTDIWDALYQGRVFSQLAAALRVLAEKADSGDSVGQDTWNRIGDSIVIFTSNCVRFALNPTDALPSIIAQGLFRAALRCLPHVDPDQSNLASPSTGAVAAIEDLLPYFYVGRIYSAAANRGDLDEFTGQVDFWNPPPRLRVAKALYIWRLCVVELGRARNAHHDRKGSNVNMCSNINHVDRHPQSEQASVKICNGCHWVTYCSKECQKEDWVNLHSQECRYTARRAKGFFLTSSRNILDLRRSQLLYLESHINEYGLEEIFRRAGPPPACPAGAPVPILIQNFVITSLQEGPDGPGTVPQYTDEYDDGGEMAARIAQFVQDSRADPGRITLIEGHFQLSYEAALRMLVKVEYDPSKESDPELRITRYKIVGSVLRLIPSAALIWPDVVANAIPRAI